MDYCFSIKEHAYCFRFCCWGHSIFERLTDDKNGTVQFGLGRAIGRLAIAKVEMASDAATGFGKD